MFVPRVVSEHEPWPIYQSSQLLMTQSVGEAMLNTFTPCWASSCAFDKDLWFLVWEKMSFPLTQALGPQCTSNIHTFLTLVFGGLCPKPTMWLRCAEVEGLELLSQSLSSFLTQLLLSLFAYTTWRNTMNYLKGRLSETVCYHPHMYNSLLWDYKGMQKTQNYYGEIREAAGCSEERQWWHALRSPFECGYAEQVWTLFRRGWMTYHAPSFISAYGPLLDSSV